MMSVVRLCAPVERDGERALQLRWEGYNFAVFVHACVCAFVICQHSSHVYKDVANCSLLHVKTHNWTTVSESARGDTIF